jgi:hypothetical protein
MQFNGCLRQIAPITTPYFLACIFVLIGMRRKPSKYKGYRSQSLKNKNPDLLIRVYLSDTTYKE